MDNIASVPDNERSKPPSKRLRLDDFEHAYNKCPGQILNRYQTPIASGSGPIDFLSRILNMRPACPMNQIDGTKEHRQVSSILGRQIELTYRPARRRASAIDNSFPASWLPSSMAPSKVSKLTRRSSPTKQLRNVELEETGLLRVDFRNDTKPILLDALTVKLEKIDRGFGILPNRLRDDLANECSIAAWNSGDSLELRKTQLPDIHPMQKIYNLATRCFKNNHLESSWIGPFKTVDYCICIQPKKNSPQYEAIQSLSKYRPELSINHTDWADLTNLGYGTAPLQEIKFLPVGICELVISLQKLVDWTRDKYWPTFQASVLGL
ncbi:hypothetical protein BJX63DRAFT_444556 [Aspergillus granulosus]|uniref:PD-(D/E)XK nuclease-like domain-containing protein n=1 Tax=Aspergillus granulosus TaxID=176169 RepID=A0ABR4H566_9EURO